jgi:cytochrome c peroxidase
MKLRHLSLAISLGFLTTACNDSTNDKESSSDLNSELRDLIVTKQITALDTPEQTPAVDSPIVTLGKKLFFTKALSGDMDTACASCHHPNLGGGDDLALPIGVAADSPDLLGPGRIHNANGEHHDGGPTVPRNAPSTFNFIFYNQFSFHDGRVENLSDPAHIGGTGDIIRTPDSDFGSADMNAGDNIAAAQARFPVTSPEEMRGFAFEAGNSRDDVREHLAQRLRGDNNELSQNDWLAEFQTGFEQPEGTKEMLITYDNVAFALGEYERSQVLVNNPWQQYLAGDDNAIDDAAKRGALLFYRGAEQGGFDCASCHSGSFFTDESFHVVAIPQIGRGKGDGATGDDDFGRFKETKLTDDRYAFRTPHLLNITDTAPYGHSGAYATLTDVIKHHLNPAQAIAEYDASNVQPGLQTDNWQANTQAALTQLIDLRSKGQAQLQDHDYSEQDVADLVSFLSALEDPCTQDPACMNKWVPSNDESDPDGLRLIAVDQNGNLL